MTGLIYLLTSSATQKVYVGQTTATADQRWRWHLDAARRNSTYLYRAMRKYGSETFKLTVIETLIDCDKPTLDLRERYWIAHYQSNDHEVGFNLTEGGGGVAGLAIEVRQHLSDIRRGRKVWSEEQKAERAEVLRARWAALTEQERKDLGRKISTAQKGRVGSRNGATNSPEHRQKISDSLKGKPSGMKGKVMSDDHKRRISEANRGRVISDEERQKRREAALRRHARERDQAQPL